MTTLIMEKSEPVWQQIYNDLSVEVKNFDFGQRFYTLAEICRKYEVSGITARRVLSEMEQKGLVEKIRRRGTIAKNCSEKLSIKFILPAGMPATAFSTEPVLFRIYNGVAAETAKMKISLETISENYFSSLSLNSRQKIGFLIFQQTCDANFPTFLKDNALPFVFLLLPAKGEFASVRVNIKRGGYLAAKHLASLGHQRIGLITGPISLPFFLPRFKGYIKALKEEKIKFDWLRVKETSGKDPDEDEIALKELLDLPSPPTAIVAGNDYRAMHILDYCRKNNIRIPDDLSIIGFDNISEAAITQPPLTTVDIHLKKVGAEGLNLLLRMMTEKGKKNWKDIVIKPDLVVRESTKEVM
ncbi:MAG: substrate-binding domain-containing protein [Candidatus Omnitrophota bacterium]